MNKKYLAMQKQYRDALFITEQPEPTHTSQMKGYLSHMLEFDKL